MSLSTNMNTLFSADLTAHLPLLLIGGVCAFLLSYLLTFGVIAISRRAGWLDRPTVERRRIHKVPVPRLGGVAIFLAFVIASLLFYTTDHDVLPDEMIRYILLLIASLLIVIVHSYDDVKGLKPVTKLVAQTIAVIVILGPWGTRFNGVLLYGFSNPFGIPGHHLDLPWYRQPEITLFIHTPDITLLVIPAVLFTWFWIVGMMNTVNFIDGVDGLATGVVGIVGLFVTIISFTLQQYSIAMLAVIFTGAVLGFLPHNWNPAKIFMGDSGSQFLGLGLAVLSIIGGAKVALALMILGIPILDIAMVIFMRVRRGYSPAHYDTTSHLHYRLLAAGLNARQICYLFYGLTILFGVLALKFERIYKLAGIGLVVLTMVAIILWIDHRQRQRGVPLKLEDGPDQGPEQDSPATGDIERGEHKPDVHPENVHEGAR
jgi:UDP-GlcNAc:undecaprenyl-phosphate/decaprenyl-phosphate GlcNAc-1-phosphate transferase